MPDVLVTQLGVVTETRYQRKALSRIVDLQFPGFALLPSPSLGLKFLGYDLLHPTNPSFGLRHIRVPTVVFRWMLA